jgi:hypothetical protein
VSKVTRGIETFTISTIDSHSLSQRKRHNRYNLNISSEFQWDKSGYEEDKQVRRSPYRKISCRGVLAMTDDFCSVTKQNGTEFKGSNLAMNIENAQVHRMNHFEDRKCNPNGGFTTRSLDVEAEWEALNRSIMWKGVY